MASERPDARTLADQMIVTIADRLRDGEAVATGLNSHIPIMAVAVAKIVHGKKLRLLTVAEAHEPVPESVRLTYSTGDPSWAELGTVLPMIETFDLVQQGKLDVMFLGPLQIDADTNFNLSVIGPYERPKVRLTGGAASAFIAPLVKRLFLWKTKHTKRDLVERVDFVTATARNSKNEVYLFTDLCVFRFDRSAGAWTLEALHPWADLETVKENTGFRFLVGNPSRTRSPGEEEKELILRMDPQGLRLKAFY
jgi:glutaconate CoA-transferase subunit B